MKFVAAFILLVMSISCSSSKKSSQSSAQSTPFAGMKGCFLLYNLKTNTFEKTIGEACEERFPACSSFKVPLAVMAFDSGVLKDEKQVLKWDGEKRFLEAWNKDQDAKSWMHESVVWFSQRLIPKLGKKKFKEYLSKFKYGNEDVSTGITSAWLNSPSDPRGSLAINAFEQVEFMKKLWINELPVTKRSMEITRQITYLETSPNGFKLSGKTGSNFYDGARKIQLGWFISHIGNGEKEYIAVTNLSDLKPIETDKFGGYRAKEITKSMLKEAGLW
jgi:beta-lactamase class D